MECKVYYCILKSLPLVPILSQMNPVQTLHPISASPIVIFSFHIHLYLQSGLFYLGFLTKILFASIIFPMHATCSAHLILHDLITVVAFGEDYKLWISSLFSLLQNLVTCLPLRYRILLSTLVLRPSNYILPLCERPSFTPIQNKQYSCSFVHFNL